jgi:hypothetical protein
MQWHPSTGAMKSPLVRWVDLQNIYQVLIGEFFLLFCFIVRLYTMISKSSVDLSAFIHRVVFCNSGPQCIELFLLLQLLTVLILECLPSIPLIENFSKLGTYSEELILEGPHVSLNVH